MSSRKSGGSESTCVEIVVQSALLEGARIISEGEGGYRKEKARNF